eukprot:39177-Rhodomonas_salina.2
MDPAQHPEGDARARSLSLSSSFFALVLPFSLRCLFPPLSPLALFHLLSPLPIRSLSLTPYLSLSPFSSPLLSPPSFPLRFFLSLLLPHPPSQVEDGNNFGVSIQVASPTSLRAPYEISGTNVAYGSTSNPNPARPAVLTQRMALPHVVLGNPVRTNCCTAVLRLCLWHRRYEIGGTEVDQEEETVAELAKAEDTSYALLDASVPACLILSGTVSGCLAVSLPVSLPLCPCVWLLSGCVSGCVSG